MMYSSIRFRFSSLFSVLLLSLLAGCGKAPVQEANKPTQLITNPAMQPRSVELQTIYGTFVIQEPVIIDLLASNAMQRLKKINQHGINDMVKPEWAFSRYEHSVGVFLLTRMFGGSLEEQVAALLHDVSHTVFSHVGDLVFATFAVEEADSAYQDDIHEWFVEQTDILPILHRYGMRHVVTDEAKDSFRRLEQSYPDICADRLDYMLRTSYITGLITLDEVHEILQHLHFEDGAWFFDDVSYAYTFSMASALLTRYMYAAPWNVYLYKIAADVFKRALEIGLVSAKELHFSTDDIIWNRIKQSDDCVLQDLFAHIERYEDAFRLSDATDYDYFKKSKCRVVDPLVEVGTELVRLSEVCPEFAEQYESIQVYCNEGVYLKFTSLV